MKKILLSLATIGVVGAIAAGATGAWFSDTETSTGNTFTAGAIDLTVDSQQHYNGSVCALNVHGNDPTTWSWNLDGIGGYPVKGTACDGSWQATNLGAETFFKFGDIKPGDEGENTISLHVFNNDAWLKIVVGDIVDLDNSQTEPELKEVGEDTTTAGELASKMLFTAWIDNGGDNATAGDNVWQEGEQIIAKDVTLASLKATLALNESRWTITGETPTDLKPFYVGLAWTLPASEGNITQTDSLSFPIEFQVQQVRNNPNAFIIET